ncbi:MAG TPA: hypothetical protein PLK94_11235, partial [Alphaproteobacteria bacterium]|nr:hypothetical protein [Alphaproteobacteria bacterium]
MVSHSSKSKSLNKYLATLAAVALMTGFAASDSQAADCAPAGSIVIGPTMPCPTTTSTQISVNGSGQTTTQASGSTGGDIVIGPSTVVGGTAQSEFGQLLYDWNVAKTTYGTNSTQAQALESQVVSANQAKWDAVNQAVAQVQASATASAGSMTWNEYQQSLSTASTTAPSGAYNYPAATNSTEAYQKVKDGVPLQYEDLYYISSFLLVDPAVQDAVKLATDEHLAAQGGDSGLFTVGGGSTTPIMSTTSDAALAALNAKQNEYFARIEQYEA